MLENNNIQIVNNLNYKLEFKYIRRFFLSLSFFLHELIVDETIGTTFTVMESL